jgi:hypothetical protein
MSSRRIAGFSLAFVVKVTIAAVLGILVLKWLAGKVNVPGLSRAINAV